jgi:hypothetical protein
VASVFNSFSWLLTLAVCTLEQLETVESYPSKPATHPRVPYFALCDSVLMISGGMLRKGIRQLQKGKKCTSFLFGSAGPQKIKKLLETCPHVQPCQNNSLCR